MADNVDEPPAQGGSFLKRKVGPLPVWAYGAGILGVVGFVWWRNRASGGASSYPGTSADSSGTPQSTDYGTGYDYGYAAGLNATGDAGTASSSSTTGDTNSGSGTKPPLAHTRYCFRETDPSGIRRLVCSYGHWVRHNGEWKWEIGAPRGGRTDTTKNPPGPTIPIRRKLPKLQPLATVGQPVPYPVQ